MHQWTDEHGRSEEVVRGWSQVDSSDVNKDWTCKDKDKDQAYKDQDKDKD